MNHIKVPYSQTGFFSETILDYLDSVDPLRSFYAYEVDIESVPAIISNIQNKAPLHRSILVDAINDQYTGHSPHANTTDNIAKLQADTTFTITTAHQLNIFTGPMYYIYKIVNAIRVARDLNQKFPDYHFVPCYWMGSEDHDFEEVNHLHLFNKKLEWSNFQGGSIGTYTTDGILPLLDEIRSILRSGDHLDKLIDLMSKAYSTELLADAVREMLNALFGEFGLVVIDGNCRILKNEFKDVLVDELCNRSSAPIVQQQIEALAEAGYKSQAGPREINLFYTFERSRERIVPHAEGFQLVDTGTVFSHAKMMELVENKPERFSPNVILRPVHQQMVLPNIAYIGGGSEVAYWLQLRSLFDHHNVHFPMLLLRTSAQIISSNQLKKLKKLKIDLPDIFQNVDALKKSFLQRSQGEDLDLKKEHEQITDLFKSLIDKVRSVDGSLDQWIGAEGQKVHKSLDNISRRLLKSEKTKHDDSMVRIEKLRDQLFPGNVPQERKENFMSQYSKHGSNWLHDLVDILDPFEKRFYLITE